jgi:hypothetical protein
MRQIMILGFDDTAGCGELRGSEVPLQVQAGTLVQERNAMVGLSRI